MHPYEKLVSLSVAAPAYNEADGIESLVEGWLDYLRRLDLAAFEIVICNDGSRDATGGILARLARDNPELRVATHAENRGGGVAMATAIAATRQRWVLMLDADGQFPIDNIERFAEALEEHDAKAFLGAREKKQDSTGARLGSAASTLTLNALYGTRYRDFTSACQLVEGELLRSLKLEARGLNYSLEVVGRLLERGIEPVQIPIRHLPRSTGRTSRTFIRSSLERVGFVSYLGLRRMLIGRHVLRQA